MVHFIVVLMEVSRALDYAPAAIRSYSGSKDFFKKEMARALPVI
jgi:hypothetical protein